MKKKFLSSKLLLFFILLFAIFLRTYGINWDQNQHLHPDERFLTMVVGRLEIPKSFSDYLDPAKSTLNPYNKETPFYVYGTLPLSIVKILAVKLNMNDYNNIAILGRFLSVLFDVGTIIVVFKLIAWIILKTKSPEWMPYAGAFIYAILVLPIQLSHFFTVDSFFNFFVLASLLNSVYFYSDNKIKNLFLSGLFIGCAFATKISAVYILPLILFFIFFSKDKKTNSKTDLLIKKFYQLMLFALVSYISLRLLDSHMFRTANFFDVTLVDKFVNNMKEMAIYTSKKAGYFPPSIQWFDKTPFLFAFVNIAFFGVGLPVIMTAIVGAFSLFSRDNLAIRAMIIWSVLFFIYQSTRFVQSMRYFVFLYPLMAIYASFGLCAISAYLTKNKTILKIIIIIGTLLMTVWPLGFLSIYSKDHSRVTASYWIYENLPNNSTIAIEHWDDALPLRVNSSNKNFNLVSLPVFAQDNQDKWNQMSLAIKDADYVIFSSNRGYGSIMSQPDMYPIMSNWYKDFLNEKKNFVLLKEFNSYPTWCFPFTNNCVNMNDQWSEEAFTVYDHPRILIFKKTN